MGAPKVKPIVENGNGSYSAATVNGNGDARGQNTSDLAIYEQYRIQVGLYDLFEMLVHMLSIFSVF